MRSSIVQHERFSTIQSRIMTSPRSYQQQITHSKIQQAAKLIKPYIHETPVFTSTILNNISKRKLFFKCEHLQKTGSFKARGAMNALLQRPPNCPGVVTHSSGNHGQALAWAANTLGLPCTVVVPNGTSKSKTDAIEGYGAKLVFCEANQTARENECKRIAETCNYYIIPPFDHYDVIAGQGTIAEEFHRQIPDLDAILIPISGGGMSSGIAIMAKYLKPDIKIFCVEALGKDLQSCLRTKQRLWPDPPQFIDTIAEGIRLQQVGHLTFPILCDLVEKTVFSISNEEMICGMKWSYRYMKQVIEAASGAAVFAAVSQVNDELDSDINKIGVILCGGNVDIDKLPW